MSVKSIHDQMHKALEYAPDPLSGAAGGTVGGAIVGAAATGVALHGAGVTVAGVAASVSTIGLGATAGALATFAAPIIVPAMGCCAMYGAFRGLLNWGKSGFKKPDYIKDLIG